MTPPRGWTLAISASNGSYDCLLAAPDGPRQSWRDQHARELNALVARLFASAGCSPHELGAIVLDQGPGSYTGLRVAMTFGRTLGEFTGARLRTLTSLELIALRAWATDRVPATATIRVVLDAHRGRLHHAALRLSAQVELLEPPRAAEREQFYSAARAGEVVLAEAKLLDELTPKIAARGCDLEGFELRDALAEYLLHPAAPARDTSLDALEPLYLMGSYAE